MNEEIREIINIHSRFLAETAGCTGTIWKEVYSEIHDNFKEIPVWILMYEGSSLVEVYEKFKSIAEKYFIDVKGFNFTVSFELYEGNKLHHLEFLTNNQEIMRGWSLQPPLGSSPSFTRKKSELFKAQDSKRDNSGS